MMKDYYSQTDQTSPTILARIARTKIEPGSILRGKNISSYPSWSFQARNVKQP